MPGDHRDTANHNIDLLLSAGFKKQGNTSIFCKGGSCILSPAVSSGKEGHYWFDIRQVNINKIQESTNPHILIRIIPDKFIFIKLSDFSSMLSENTKKIRKNSGEVWGYYISLNGSKTAKIVSTANSSLFFEEQIQEKSNVRELLKNIA